MLGIPAEIFYHMPKSELSDLIDASNILAGNCEESVEKEDNYIPIDLR